MSKSFSVEAKLLSPHPLLKGLPTMWEIRDWAVKRGNDAKGGVYHEHREDADVVQRWCERFEEGIESRDIERPLKVVKHAKGYWVVDGRHRLEGGKAKGRQTFRCIEVPEEMVSTIILSEELERKHLTKEALAYVALRAHQEFWKESRGPGRPSKAAEIGRSAANFGSIEEFAKHVGVGKTVMKDCISFIKEIVEPDVTNGGEWVKRLFLGQSIKTIRDIREQRLNPRSDGRKHGDPRVVESEHWTKFFNNETRRLISHGKDIGGLSDPAFLTARNEFFSACPKEWRKAAEQIWNEDAE